MSSRTISQLAALLNVHVETIRFYQRKGLIEQPPKPPRGYRHYSDEVLSRMRFIKRAQELGFTLDEIANLLLLNDQPCTTVQELAELKLSSVRAKLADLARLETVLAEMVLQCQHNQDEAHCPIIESLQPK